ncbi:MAG: Calx-beta domain-containing protein, partial [Pseudomonadota bacterium]
YSLTDGSAAHRAGDYLNASSTITIPAGTQSTWISARVYRDDLIEGDEEFYLVATDITNAVFAGNAPALVATATIIDDDGGEPLQIPGTGAQGKPIKAPDPVNGQLTIDVIDTTYVEGSSSYSTVKVYLVLSEEPTSPVTVFYQTVDGTATAGSDYLAASSSFTIPAGQQATWVQIRVYGDTSIEGDEDFEVEFYNLSQGVFANGQNAISATVTIQGDDGAGSAGEAGSGPAFEYDVPPGIYGTSAGDNLRGTDDDDTIYALASNDTIAGSLGHDAIYGDDGSDTADYSKMDGPVNVQLNRELATAAGSRDKLYSIENVIGTSEGDIIIGDAGDNILSGLGGADIIRTKGGNDIVFGGGNDDRIFGEGGDETIDAGQGNDLVRSGDGKDDVKGDAGDDVLRLGKEDDTADGGAGEDRIFGNSGVDTIKGGLDGDRLYGGRGADDLHGEDGNDALRGEAGQDTLAG